MTLPTGMIGRMYASEVAKAMLAVGLVLLAATAVLIFHSDRELRWHHAEVQRVNAALLQIEEINSLVIGVDYSARGYALTGERLFLEHENTKQQRLKAAIQELAQLVDPEQRAAVSTLSRMAARHAEIYANFVAKGPGHTKEIADIITDPMQRKRRYDAIDVLQGLHDAEMASLTAHQAMAQEQQRYTSILTVTIVVLAFLGGTTDLVARVYAARARRVSDGTEQTSRAS